MTQAEALKILKTGANVFLTGEPGSGKTFVTNTYVRYLRSAKVEAAVTASTGIAATHLGGMTIHSWSGIGIKRNLSRYDVDRIVYNERIARRVMRTKVLIIDEISMLDAGILEGIDKICQGIKKSSLPFGGIQIVFVGDFFQLPPVSCANETPARFAFNSPVWKEASPFVCYLSEQHRQEDDIFLEILSAMRRNEITDRHCAVLDKRCGIAPAESDFQKITKLFSHNEDVDRINNIELEKINGKARSYSMSSVGKELLVDQLKRGCLSPEILFLKIGASVMFTKNSPTGSFVNGTLGVVIDFDDTTGNPIIKTRNGRTILAEKMDWSIEENEKMLAKISQIPLRLAWAMTVHKSQGMSLDAAFIDLRGAFIEGQGYVALSRVRNISGLYLAGWNETALRSHSKVLDQDREFRKLSVSAEEALFALSEEEVLNMHENFIKASGGSFMSGRSEKNSKESPRTYSVEKIREKSPRAYMSWPKEEDALLKAHFKSGKNAEEISKILGRQPGSIRSRLIKLELVKE